ncbi:MAG: hypothetical protein P4L42_13865 [Desulfocapsaceae bacterium]|nr:hypothetical protein [Desulfocapsaceae bacterium]
MPERQKDGVAKAKEEWKYKERKPLLVDLRQEVVPLATQGMPKIHIAPHRILAKQPYIGSWPRNTHYSEYNVNDDLKLYQSRPF